MEVLVESINLDNYTLSIMKAVLENSNSVGPCPVFVKELVQVGGGSSKTDAVPVV